MSLRFRSMLLCATLLIGSSGCYNARDALDQLAHTTDAEQEAAQLRAIWHASYKKHLQLSLSAYDASGKQVEMSKDHWWTQVTRVRLGLDGESLDYAVKRGDNLLVLLGE